MVFMVFMTHSITGFTGITDLIWIYFYSFFSFFSFFFIWIFYKILQNFIRVWCYKSWKSFTKRREKIVENGFGRKNDEFDGFRMGPFLSSLPRFTGGGKERGELSHLSPRGVSIHSSTYPPSFLPTRMRRMVSDEPNLWLRKTLSLGWK